LIRSPRTFLRDKEPDLKLKLNQLGAEGWELISITPQNAGGSAGGTGGAWVECNILVFKKPK
jgi:hypothetical protein